LCSDADANCPFFPAKTRVVHRGFDDPPRLAAGETDTEKRMDHYRRVRDEIRDFVLTLPEALDTM
ncbi:MAG: arsenate reductase, partial [Candidatus Krumholzibacteria bacterium]|nr:arsenate reductase [Candidatus Krumholzibacteria bacterium]